MSPIRSVCLFVGLSTAALAQVVLPPVAAGGLGSSATNYPWNRPGATSRVQTCYAGAELLAGGAPGPILITALRWRAETPSGSQPVDWNGGTLQGAVVTLATAATPFLAMTPDFDTNRGPDATVVHQGPLAIKANSSQPGQPGPYYVTVAPTVPFYYDPTAGDLLIDLQIDSTNLQPGDSYNGDVFSGPSVAGSRVYADGMAEATGTLQTGVAPVLQISYVPAAVLLADFSATPTVGGTPLVVQFLDESFSSNPGGVVAWNWDVDGDGVTDYTSPNPTHTYSTCGDFTVSLRVVDAYGNQKATSKHAFVRTGFAEVDFTWEPIGPETLEFTAVSSGAPTTAWSWDFDDDGLIDATGPVVQRTFPSAAQSPNGSRVTPPVTLQAYSACRGPFEKKQRAYVGRQLATRFDTESPVEHTLLSFDIEVHNPNGITITGFGQGVRDGVAMTTAYVAWCPGGQAIGEWRSTSRQWLASSGVSTAPWHLVRSFTGAASAVAPLHLPRGRHGILMIPGAFFGGQQPLRATVGADTYSNPDLTIHPGFGYSSYSMASPLGPRVWNGVVYYQTTDSSEFAGFGDVALGCVLPGVTIDADFHASSPRIGEVADIPVNGLPAGGLALLGIAFGQIELPLDPLGAPGCTARVPLEATFAMVGDGNGNAAAPVAVPDDIALIGVRLFNQGIALVPGINALGLAFLDTRVGLIGR